MRKTTIEVSLEWLESIKESAKEKMKRRPFPSEAYIEARAAYDTIQSIIDNSIEEEVTNKPYFAKYLPVEGQIEDKDYWVDDEGRIWECKIDLCFTPMGKKVKLFLCSRDIQIGDSDVRLGSMGGTGTSIPDTQESADHLRYLGGFKVIGQISPKSKWVKEGDEFDEEEVRKGDRVREDFTAVVGGETRTLWGDRVKIVEVGVRFADGHLCEYLDEAELNHHLTCRKGETYIYEEQYLGYTEIHYYKIQCPYCEIFH